MSDSKMTAAARDVLAERERQVSVEGWTPAHDDENDDGQLASAAACYAFPTWQRRGALAISAGTDMPSAWPWAREWWKPSPDDRRRELVKAGALILAEIERLDRAKE